MNHFLWKRVLGREHVRARDAYLFLVINVAISTAISGFFLPNNQYVAITIVSLFAAGLLIALAAAAWTHMWVFALGGRGVEKTAAAVWLAMTPWTLFGWAGNIPLVGNGVRVILIIAVIVLLSRHVQCSLSKKRAIIAAVGAVLSAGVLFILFAIWALLIYLPTLMAL